MIAPSKGFGSAVVSVIEFEAALEQRRVKKAQRLNQAPLSAVEEAAKYERIKADNERMKKELKRHALANSPAKISYSEAGIDYIEAATTLIASMKKGLYT